MAPRPSPTARRRRLAAALRQMREQRQWSCADAGKAVGWSESKISRIETGRVGFRQPDLERLLDLYEVTGEARTALLALGRQATHRGWWHSYADALPAYFEDYVGLEDGAKSLSTYQNQLVHGLMQTADYAAAVFRAAQPAASTDEVERQLAARTTRQALLTARTRCKCGPSSTRRCCAARSAGGRSCSAVDRHPGDSSAAERHLAGTAVRYGRARVDGHLVRALAVP